MPSRSRACAGLARLKHLPPAERRIVYAATVGLPLAALALAVMPLGRVLAALPRDPRCAGQVFAPDRVVALVAAVASRLPGRPSCLPQAVVAAWLLARAGHRSRVVVGAQRRGTTLAAHAWVEVGGRPAGPLPGGSWTPLVAWPAVDGA